MVWLTEQPGPSRMQAKKKKGILTLDHPNPETDSHLPAAATAPPPQPEAICSLKEVVNGRAKTKTTKTLPGSAAA